MTTGCQLIEKERKEQQEKHGYSRVNDLKYTAEELSDVAAYLLTANDDYWPGDWSYSLQSKFDAKSYKDRLIIAGALIAAEIDRLILEEALQKTEEDV